MTQNTNTHNSKLDASAGRLGHHSLINAIILSAIDDLGHDALSDEGVLDWIIEPADTDYNVDNIRKWVDHMPLKKNGRVDARPAMRRVMEALDARNMTATEEVEIHFDQIALDNMPEPTEGDLAELENMTWETE